MVIMPLGPQLIAHFALTDAQFGLLVSAYTFAAGASGLLAATYIDRFDRRKLLLALYVGFALATLACGLAFSFESFLLARVGAGFFGGVLTALSQTIVADLIPFERRGKAMGVVMTAFSVSSVLGVPFSLTLAVHTNWHMPFFALAALSGVLVFQAQRALPAMTGHLRKGEANAGGPLDAIGQVLSRPVSWLGFGFTFFLIFASFVIIPYITLFTQTNAGVPAELIPLVYFLGGGATLLTAPLLGRLSDKWGKWPTLKMVALGASFPMLLMTQVDHFPLPVLFVVSTAFFILVSGRMIPGMALISSAVEPSVRGTFMTLNSSVQSAAMGLSALVGGMILGRSPDGLITHYWVCGALGIACNLLGLILAYQLSQRLSRPPSGGSAI